MVKENLRGKSPSRKDTASSISPSAKSTDSRSKRKSPSRASPSRTKSPSRNSPARTKSPSRNKKESAVSPAKKTNRKKSPSRVNEVKESKKAAVTLTRIEADFSASDEEYIPKEKPKATVRGRTRKTETEETQNQGKLFDNSYGIRRITRNSAAQEERIVHLKNFEIVAKKLGEFSDDDEITISSKIPEEKVTILEKIGILFQIIFAPVFVIMLYIFCNKTQCTFRTLPEFRKFSFSFLFDLRALFGYFIFVILLAILSVLPFTGRKITSLPSKLEKFVYVMNGFFSFCFIVGTFSILDHFQLFNVWNFINEHTVHFLSSSILFGTIFSFYLYARSFYVTVSCLNPTEIGKPSLNGFFYGREINPRFFNILDLKIFILRICCITLIMSDIAVLSKTFNFDMQIATGLLKFEWRPLFTQPTLLLLVLFHLTYAVDNLIFENKILSSYFVQYEGLGYRTVLGILLSPFLLIAQTKYVADYNVRISKWEMGILSLVFMVGYVLYRMSNNQKDAFRRNPYGPASADLESIPTAQGKKLICSSYWGLVRQPNILGDLIMHLTLLRFCYDVPCVIGVLAIALMLIERALSAQAICKGKYGSSWDKYCQKVKYVLVPKIF